MASIVKRGNAYLITVCDGVDANGKTVRKHMTFHPTETAPTKIQKEVQRAASDFEKRVKSGAYYEGDRMSFRDLAEKWYQTYANQNISLSIREGYHRMLENLIYPAIGTMPITKIKPLNLQEIYDGLLGKGRSASTIRNYHKVISSIFKAAYNWNLIEMNPCDRVVLPKITQRYNYTIWSPEQVQLFFDALKTEYTIKYKERHRTDGSGNEYAVAAYDVNRSVSSMYIALYTLLLYTSARRGEVCALTWNDVDFEAHEINIDKAVSNTHHGQIIKGTKTAAGTRRIYVQDQVLDALRTWKEDQQELSLQLGSMWQGYSGDDYDMNYIFIQKDSGKMIYIDTIGQKFHDIINAYNETAPKEKQLPVIRLHDLRHTGASLMIANGVDFVTVSKRLGHAKPSTTLDIYSHALPSKDRAAADVLASLISS